MLRSNCKRTTTGTRRASTSPGTSRKLQRHHQHHQHQEDGENDEKTAPPSLRGEVNSSTSNSSNNSDAVNTTNTPTAPGTAVPSAVLSEGSASPNSSEGSGSDGDIGLIFQMWSVMEEEDKENEKEDEDEEAGGEGGREEGGGEMGGGQNETSDEEQQQQHDDDGVGGRMVSFAQTLMGALDLECGSILSSEQQQKQHYQQQWEEDNENDKEEGVRPEEEERTVRQTLYEGLSEAAMAVTNEAAQKTRGVLDRACSEVAQHQADAAREWQKVAIAMHSTVMQLTGDKEKLQDSNYTLILENHLLEGEVSHLHQLHGIGVQNTVETTGKVDASTNTDTDINTNGNAGPNDSSPTKMAESPSGTGQLGSTEPKATVTTPSVVSVLAAVAQTTEPVPMAATPMTTAMTTTTATTTMAAEPKAADFSELYALASLAAVVGSLPLETTTTATKTTSPASPKPADPRSPSVPTAPAAPAAPTAPTAPITAVAETMSSAAATTTTMAARLKAADFSDLSALASVASLAALNEPRPLVLPTTTAMAAEPKAADFSELSVLVSLASLAAVVESLPLETTTTKTTTASPASPKPANPRSPPVPTAPVASTAPTASAASTATTPTRVLFSDENKTPQHGRVGKPSAGATVGRPPWVGVGTGGAAVSTPRCGITSMRSPLSAVPINTTPRVVLADKARAQKAVPRNIASVMGSPVEGGDKKARISWRGGSGGGGGSGMSRAPVARHDDGARTSIEAAGPGEKVARRSSAPRPTASGKAAARQSAAVATTRGVPRQGSATRSQLADREEGGGMAKRLRSAGRPKTNGPIAVAGGQKAVAGTAVSSRTRQAKAANKATAAAAAAAGGGGKARVVRKRWV